MYYITFLIKTLLLRTVVFLLFFTLPFSDLMAQYTISGLVLDKSKKNRVDNVQVISTGGMFTVTDTLGQYRILVKPGDSLSFIYKNKPTQQFPVNNIANPQQFDISLHLDIESKYNMMKEVIVYSKSYKEDSLENRQTYASVFQYQKPGLSTSITPGGGAGADVNELINVFRFKRNKRLKKFQERLEAQEQDKFIDYRFNKLLVSRVTGFKDNVLDTFLVWYRPSYEFCSLASEVQFNQYLLSAASQYRKIMPLGAARKPD
jgi:hypothetical protein